MQIDGMNITVDTNAAEIAGKKLGCILAERKKQPVLLMLSGGSSLGILKHVSSDALSEELTVTMLDERYSDDPSASNFEQLTRLALYRALERAGARLIDTRPKHNRRTAETTERFRRAIEAWRNDHPDGCVLVTQGIGVDGHTAGILPFPAEEGRFRELFEKGVAVEYSVPPSVNAFPHRLTVTLSFLRDTVDTSIVFVAGEEKEEAVGCILAHRGDLHKAPARILREMKNVHLFTPLAIVEK